MSKASFFKAAEAGDSASVKAFLEEQAPASDARPTRCTPATHVAKIPSTPSSVRGTQVYWHPGLLAPTILAPSCVLCREDIVWQGFLMAIQAKQADNVSAFLTHWRAQGALDERMEKQVGVWRGGWAPAVMG